METKKKSLLLAGAILAASATHIVGEPRRADDAARGHPRGRTPRLVPARLNRAPDAAGERIHLDQVADDCETGVLRFSYEILTSAEARNFLNSADRKTNAIYMAPLNRVPTRAAGGPTSR